MRRQVATWARLLLVGLALVAAAGPVAAAQSNPDPRESPEVRKLIFRGVESVVQRLLERSIRTEASECKSLLLQPFCWFSRSPTFVEKHYFDQEDFQRDVLRIRAYYWARGFREAQVDTAVVKNGDDGVTVVFDVHENRPTLVRRVAIEYDSTLLRQRQVEKLATLRAGEPLDLIQLDSMRVGFESELWSKGYGDAIIDTAIVIDRGRYLADVTLRIDPNHPTTVASVTVEGLERVDTSTVLRAITLQPGRPFRRQGVLESQRNLYESNLFRLVSITVPDTGPPRLRSPDKRVQILVSEAPLREARIGTGFTNIDFVQADARYTSYNLFGGARRLELAGTVGNLLAEQLRGRGFFYDPASLVSGGDTLEYLAPTWSTSVSFTQPAFLRNPSNQIGLNAFAHRRAMPGIFIDRGYGGAATLTRNIRPRAPLSLTYRFEINRVDAGDTYFCVNFGVCDTTTIRTLRSHQKLSPLSLSGFVDRSDIPLGPTKGYVARADLEHASSATVSEYRYNRAYLDAAAYTHRGLHVFAAHLRVGIVRGSRNANGSRVLHPRKRFYAGGASSVRGYPENQLGPRILTVSPDSLLAGSERAGVPCDVTTEAVRNCNPNLADLGDDDFIPQPLGGTSLVEGSIEWRFPTPLHRKLNGALFIDAGVVGQSAEASLASLARLTKGTGAITPGFGFRYQSPVGPIRFDVGVNPKVAENLPVVTEVIVNGERKIIPLLVPRRFSPGGKTLLDRLTLHFSIGQAY